MLLFDGPGVSFGFSQVSLTFGLALLVAAFTASSFAFCSARVSAVLAAFDDDDPCSLFPVAALSLPGGEGGLSSFASLILVVLLGGGGGAMYPGGGGGGFGGFSAVSELPSLSIGTEQTSSLNPMFSFCETFLTSLTCLT